MSIDQIKQRISDQKSMLRKSGVEHVAVFGSRARGDNRPNSDLDVLLDLADGASFSLFDLARVELNLSKITGLSANVFLRRSLDHKFYDAIKPDVQAVF